MCLHLLRLLFAISLGVGEVYPLHCFVCSYEPTDSTIGCSGDPENDGDFVELCPPDMNQCFWRRISSKSKSDSILGLDANYSHVRYEAGCANTSTPTSCESNTTEEKEIEVCIGTCDWIVCNYPTNSFTESLSDTEFIIDDIGFTTDSDLYSSVSVTNSTLANARFTTDLDSSQKLGLTYNPTQPTAKLTTSTGMLFTSSVTNKASDSARFIVYRRTYCWQLHSLAFLAFLRWLLL